MADSSKKQRLSRGRPFAKGQSGNPGGRKSLPLNVVAICREVTVEAVQEQIRIMRLDDKGDPAILGVKVRITESLLNRGWGSAPQVVVVEGDMVHHIRRVVIDDPANARN